MLNKKIYLILCFFVFSCSGFEFVHDKKLVPNILKNKTVVSVTGGDSPVLTRSLNEKIGKTESHIYKLKVVSKKTTTDVIKESDMTASLIEIKFDISYELVLVEKNCIIFSKTISSKSTHNLKAGGYNFGSDISKNEIIEDILSENITKYLNYISTNYSILTC